MKSKNWDHTRIYKTEHILEVKERSQAKKSKISFDMGISCNNKNESIRRLFTRENYLINSQRPEDHHIRLLYELEQAIYPLEIEVNTYENFEKIPGHGLWFSNWQKKTEEMLKNSYEGEFAESLKNQVQQSLETEEKLKQKIQQEAFWRLYFFGMQTPQNDKIFRWNVLKADTLYFSGDVQTEIKGDEQVSLYLGKLERLEENFIENLNKLLRMKKTDMQYISPDQIEAQCKVQCRWKNETGKLLNKTAEIKVKSIHKNYLYSEKIEINYHGISMRKMSNPSSFSFFLSEKEQEKDIQN